MILKSEEDTRALGALLAHCARAGDVITLSGPLGVGKTALARGFIEALGHQGDVPSPSFAIVQPYDELEPRVWHVDLYRIEEPSEIEELGLDAAADTVVLLDAHPDAGVAAPRLCHPDGTIEPNCRRFPTPGTLALRLADQRRPREGATPA